MSFKNNTGLKAQLKAELDRRRRSGAEQLAKDTKEKLSDSSARTGADKHYLKYRTGGLHDSIKVREVNGTSKVYSDSEVAFFLHFKPIGEGGAPFLPKVITETDVKQRVFEAMTTKVAQ